ncbi:uncharacterized protein BP5553_09375 [Venustampulla echinocandica]|uniref:Ankyrin n=1 Tax=Venustampulla echinocandica TaxID=2656787 RepID=A0A370TCJ3_9HELO|nr:uncharacterized protein BP5553_09375 [Venustampulla echinocandica]RDL31973.1 hypothetical protein BP5553_09375 [Venustampulla echinocandica]
MQLPEISAELIDHIFAALLDLIGPKKTLRLRVVNQFFNDTIVRAVTDSYVRYRNGPFHYWLDKWIKPPKERSWSQYRRVSPPMMCRFIEAQMKSDFVQLPLLALRDVLQTLDELSPVSEPERKKRARQIYQAAADYLDWDRDHKFALSWPGNNPRIESSDVDEKRQILFGAAVVSGNISTVRNLLEDAPVDVNYESPYLGRPLQLAARWGHIVILELLLVHGADPVAMQVQTNQLHPADHYQSRSWGMYYSSHGSALQVACLARHVSIVRTLLRPQNALPSEHCRSALCSASRGGHVQVIQALLEALPDLDAAWKHHTLLTACRQGSLEVAKMMIRLGVPPHFISTRYGCRPHTALRVAAMRGHANIVRLLIENLPDICNDRQALLEMIKIPMDLAVRYGHLECVDALFNLGGFNTNYYWAHRLITGAIPHLALVRLLVRLGIDLDQIGPGKDITLGQDALLDAVERDREPVVRVLLELGVPPNSPNQLTHPVLRAKVYDNGDVLKTLLEFGGDDIDVLGSVYTADFKFEAGREPYPRRIGDRSRGDDYPKGWRGRDF